mgnify:CR=1 FL=1
MLSAIILCGGEGLRLRPLTRDLPKPLIQLNKKPILHYIITHLLDSGITDFYIATGYRSKQIEDFMNKKFRNILPILQKVASCT